MIWLIAAVFLVVVQETAVICSDCEGLASCTGSGSCSTKSEVVLIVVWQMPGWGRENRKPFYIVPLFRCFWCCLADCRSSGGSFADYRMILMVVRQTAALILVVISADFNGSGGCFSRLRWLWLMFGRLP